MRKIKPTNPHPDDSDPQEPQQEQEIREYVIPDDDTAEVLEELQKQVVEAQASRQRALADFANFQRRAAENEIRARQQGVASVIRSILSVLDHFDLALAQDPTQVTVDQILGGVGIVRNEFTKALESHGVQRIEPAIGEEFDPSRHEAVMQQGRPGVAPNHIANVLQAGYAMGDSVLRPAKVAVAPEGDDSPQSNPHSDPGATGS